MSLVFAIFLYIFQWYFFMYLFNNLVKIVIKASKFFDEVFFADNVSFL